MGDGGARTMRRAAAKVNLKVAGASGLFWGESAPSWAARMAAPHALPPPPPADVSGCDPACGTGPPVTICHPPNGVFTRAPAPDKMLCLPERSGESWAQSNRAERDSLPQAARRAAPAGAGNDLHLPRVLVRSTVRKNEPSQLLTGDATYAFHRVRSGRIQTTLFAETRALHRRPISPRRGLLRTSSARHTPILQMGSPGRRHQHAGQIPVAHASGNVESARIMGGRTDRRNLRGGDGNPGPTSTIGRARPASRGSKCPPTINAAHPRRSARHAI